MRVLLDECLPARLRRDLPGHEVKTVPQAGWASIKNGQLLRRITASGKFAVFVTMDKSLPHQQPISDLPFGVFLALEEGNAVFGIGGDIAHGVTLSPGIVVVPAEKPGRAPSTNSG